MALDQYHHGVRVVESDDGSRAIQTVSTSVIGVICTGKDADASAFPLDTPVLINDLSTAVGKAGRQGTLRRTLTAIAGLVSTSVIVVRVADGDKEDGIKANVIGTTLENGKRTGLKALLTAEAVTGLKPRIIGAPELAWPEVATEIASVCKKLRAFGYVQARGCATKEDATAYRRALGARELMVLWPAFISFDTSSRQNVVISPEAYALGLRAQIDQAQGWHKSLSNVEVSGVTGIEPPTSWDLQSPDTDAGYLNQNQVTTLVRSSGFRFWGSRTCDNVGSFKFENYTRTAQVLADTIAEAHMYAVDKQLTPALARDIVSNVNASLRSLKTQGYILGGSAWLSIDNGKEQLAAGKLRISYEYTPVPPLEDLGFTQVITDSYLADFSAQAK